MDKPNELVWTESYQFHKCQLFKGLIVVTVGWCGDKDMQRKMGVSKHGYIVSISGRSEVTLKRIFESVDTGKQAGLEWVRKNIAEPK